MRGLSISAAQLSRASISSGYKRSIVDRLVHLKMDVIYQAAKRRGWEDKATKGGVGSVACPYTDQDSFLSRLDPIVPDSHPRISDGASRLLRKWIFICRLNRPTWFRTSLFVVVGFGLQQKTKNRRRYKTKSLPGGE